MTYVYVAPYISISSCYYSNILVIKYSKQEDGWVVCRVFKKKNHNRSPFQADDRQDHTLHADDDHHHHLTDHDMNKNGQSLQPQTLHNYDCNISNTTLFDHGSMHLPQLHDHTPFYIPPHQGSHLINNNNDNNDMNCSRNLLSLMSANPPQDKPLLATNNVTADWSFLDKLLASNQHHSGVNFDSHNQQALCNDPLSSQTFHHPDVSQSSHVFPFHYLGYETDILKFSK